MQSVPRSAQGYSVTDCFMYVPKKTYEIVAFSVAKIASFVSSCFKAISDFFYAREKKNHLYAWNIDGHSILNLNLEKAEDRARFDNMQENPHTPHWNVVSQLWSARDALQREEKLKAIFSKQQFNANWIKHFLLICLDRSPERFQVDQDTPLIEMLIQSMQPENWAAKGGNASLEKFIEELIGYRDQSPYPHLWNTFITAVRIKLIDAPTTKFTGKLA